MHGPNMMGMGPGPMTMENDGNGPMEGECMMEGEGPME